MDPRLTNILLVAALTLLTAVTVVQLLLSRRRERVLASDLAKTLADVRELREEVQAKYGSLVKSMVPASTVTRSIDDRLDRARESVQDRLQEMHAQSMQRLEQASAETLAVANAQRQESAAALEKAKETMVVTLDRYSQYLNRLMTQALTDHAASQKSQIATVVEHLTQLIEATDERLSAYRRECDARMERIQAEVSVVTKFASATRLFGATLAHEFEHSAEAEHFPGH